MLRINITYSVDIEQLIPEVHRRIKQCIEELRTIEDILGDIELEGDLQSSLEKISEARTRMLSVDYNLRDNTNILNGYAEVREDILRDETVAGEIYER